MALRRIINLEDVQTDLIRRLKVDESLVGVSQLPSSRRLPAGGAVVSVGTQQIRTLEALMKRGALLDAGGQNVGYTAAFLGTDIVENALTNAPAATFQNLSLFLAAMAESSNRKQGLARIHEVVASKALAAVQQAYDSRFPGDNRYRAGQNRESGKLGPALRNPNLVRAQKDGILFMNRQVLDSQAKHWYRLNFGAQPAGRQRRPGQFPISFDGQSLGSIGLDDRPSGRFSLPTGIWLAGGSNPVPHNGARGRSEGSRGRTSSDQFYTVKWFFQRAAAVRGEGDASFKKFASSLTGMAADRRKRGVRSGGRIPFTKRVETKGIRGAHFFDAGVRVIATQLPLEYSSLLIKWQSEASRSGTGPVAKVIARPE